MCLRCRTGARENRNIKQSLESIETAFEVESNAVQFLRHSLETNSISLKCQVARVRRGSRASDVLTPGSGPRATQTPRFSVRLSHTHSPSYSYRQKKDCFAHSQPTSKVHEMLRSYVRFQCLHIVLLVLLCDTNQGAPTRRCSEVDGSISIARMLTA